MASHRGARGRRRSKDRLRVDPQQLPRIHRDVAGIDLGSQEHCVCGPVGEDGKVTLRAFPAHSAGLHALGRWLLQQDVQSVAMESTHVYWIPLFELLESLGMEVVLVNARQLHGVPGRKTDMADCQWLQLLHSCGLLRGSFRPHESICRLRTLRRQQGNLVAERTRAVQWMQKSLDQMNVLVHRAVTDLQGKTGLGIVRAIVAGERDPLKLAGLRDARCRKSEEEIAQLLTGTWRSEHLFNLKTALELFDVLEGQISEYEQLLRTEIQQLIPEERVNAEVPPHPIPRKEAQMRRLNGDLREVLWRVSGADLTQIDGVSAGVALMIVTEVGLDLSAFPTEKHFVSWLRLSPRTAYSGGKALPKRKSSMGATRISNALRMAALSLKKSQTALGAYFRRIARRRDGGVAVFATARKLATLVYRMLRHGADYVDIGQESYEQRFQEQRLEGITKAAKQLGYRLIPVTETS